MAHPPNTPDRTATPFGLSRRPAARRAQGLTQTTYLYIPVQTRYVVYVRIGEPARKHGVADADIWHAVRTATRRIAMDEDLTMLIGPACNGTLLEVGVLDLDGHDPAVIHAMPLRPKFYRFLDAGR